MRIKQRVAVIGCSPPGIRFTYKNKRRTIREIMAERIREFSLFEPAIHHPVKDISDFPDIGKVSAVIIPGSQLNVDDETLSKTEWMRKLLDFIREVHGKRPMLGVCFGHQAIAKALGSDVVRFHQNVEVGAIRLELTEEGRKDALFKGIPPEFVAFFSHFFYVKTLPKGGVLLAKNDTPSIQAYRNGITYGVQFHPDYDPGIIEEIVETRKEILSAIMPLSEIVTRPRERHDEAVLKNFLDLAWGKTRPCERIHDA